MIYGYLLAVFFFTKSQAQSYFIYTPKGERIEGIQATVSPDGNTLFFIKQIQGEIAQKLDMSRFKDWQNLGYTSLYRSYRINDSIWSEPEQLSELIDYDTLNKRFRSSQIVTPFISKNGKFLFWGKYFFGTVAKIPQIDIWFSELSSKKLNPKPINEGMGLAEYCPSLCGEDSLYFLYKNLNSTELVLSKKNELLWQNIAFTKLPLYIKPDFIQYYEGNSFLINKINDPNLYIIEKENDNWINLKLFFKLPKNTLPYYSFSQEKLYFSVAFKEKYYLKYAKLNENKANISIEIQFLDQNTTLITDTYLLQIDKIVPLLKDNKSLTIEVSGHTDNIGLESDNLKLSKKRAEAVANYLISKGIEKTKIQIKFYGSSKAIADNNTEEGRKKNRRVEIIAK